MKVRTNPGLDTACCDVFIAPDGRIRVFGLSDDVLEVLCRLAPNDEQLAARRRRSPAAEPTGSVDEKDAP
ncbi:MAG: hypothetical protein ACRDD1_09160 [Planctomycetia bacterium]